MMRMSRLFGRTLREAPADVEGAGHQHLVRAAFVRGVGMGRTAYLPLGQRSLAALESELRDWYLEVFSAEPGERRGLPSALVPGGRVDFIPARGEVPKPSRGAAIDHIGFEVADMDAFAAHIESLGIEFDRPPTRVEEIGLTIAFITDPAGTYIEITEGLDEVE